MNRTSSVLLALPLVAAMACAQSQGAKVRDARMERVDAQAQARADAIDKEAAARHDAVDQRFAAEKSAIDNSNQEAQGASGELVEVAKQRALYEAEAKARVDKMMVRLEAAKEKLDILGPAAPSSIQQTLQTAATEHNALQQDVSKLSNVPPDQWGPNKDTIEQRMTTLDERLKGLNQSINDVQG